MSWYPWLNGTAEKSKSDKKREDYDEYRKRMLEEEKQAIKDFCPHLFKDEQED